MSVTDPRIKEMQKLIDEHGSSETVFITLCMFIQEGYHDIAAFGLSYMMGEIKAEMAQLMIVDAELKQRIEKLESLIDTRANSQRDDKGLAIEKAHGEFDADDGWGN